MLFDGKKWKSKDVSRVLRLISGDEDAAVKAITVLTSLDLVGEDVAVDFARYR